jgi:hypothetical protein
MHDYDYMNECIQRRKDPFIVTTKWKMDAWVLKNALFDVLEELNMQELNEAKDFPYTAPLEKEYEPIGGTRMSTFEKARLEQFVVRLGMATLGGSFLIGPMWLMVLHNTLYTALISTTVCVLIFGVIMAWVQKSLMDVLSITAAYAAVLVVFVGTNTVA